MMDIADELIDGMIAEQQARLDDFIAREMSALYAAARGVEFIPGVVQILRQRRAKMTAWRDARLAELELALVAEARRFHGVRHDRRKGRTPGAIRGSRWACDRHRRQGATLHHAGRAL
jgi:hypothetical protein